jgi:hypothetical protein
MTEGLINLVDDDSSQDVQAAHPVSADEDRLATSRLQAHAPLPVPSRRPQSPQATGAAVVPPPRPSYPTGAGAPRTMLYPSEPPAALPRTSWWRSLIASTLAPAAQEDATAERRAGAACIGFAVVFSLTALLVGLRAAPSDAAAPGIAVAVVLARAALALGLLAFGYALLRMGERLLTPRLGRRPEG